MGSELYSANWQYVGHFQSKHFENVPALMNMKTYVYL